MAYYCTRRTAISALLGKESTCLNWLNNYIIGLVINTGFGYGCVQIQLLDVDIKNMTMRSYI